MDGAHLHATECVRMHVLFACILRPSVCACMSLCVCIVSSMLCAYVHELDRMELVHWRVYMRGYMRPVHVWLVAWLSI